MRLASRCPLLSTLFRISTASLNCDRLRVLWRDVPDAVDGITVVADDELPAVRRFVDQASAAVGRQNASHDRAIVEHDAPTTQVMTRSYRPYAEAASVRAHRLPQHPSAPP